MKNINPKIEENNRKAKIAAAFLCLVMAAGYYFAHRVPPTVESPKIFVADKEGRTKNNPKFGHTYSLYPTDSLKFPAFNDTLARALLEQMQIFSQKNFARQYHIGNLHFSHKKLEETIFLLQECIKNKVKDYQKYFDFYQLSGADGRGNVRFTGYFTPILRVSREKSEAFPYPIRLVSADDGLEQIFSGNPKDARKVAMQGSAYVEFADKKRYLLNYNGTENAMESEEFIPDEEEAAIPDSLQSKFAAEENLKDLEDTSDFLPPTSVNNFKLDNQKNIPRGASGASLVANYSIAADKRLVPMGACFLAAVPVTGGDGKFLYHEFRFLLAQDTGGGVKGKGHVDLYLGAGAASDRHANNLHHFGQLWLILAKETKPNE